MDEFKKLDPEKQQEIRAMHHVKNVEEQKEIERNKDKYLFYSVFLPLKHVNPDTFDSLAQWKREEWRRQFEEWKWEQQFWERQRRKTKDEIMFEEAMSILAECHVPFDPCGTPLGIGWDD